MKKLMIAAAAVAMAAGVQAAKVDWRYSDCTGDTTDQYDYIGATVYAIAGTIQTTWKTVDDVKAAQMANGSGVVSQRDESSVDTGIITSSDSKLANYYFVIVSADEKMYGTYAGDSSFIYDEESPFEFEFSSYEVTPTTKFSGVPEPTSGLLMLLGVAGLALKRKRA